jgi:cellulose synthase/poly-beta-1,6-N-acetylglucosamine synthase-like glycosyltransferase/peptidoglycan/xylan/chitin deacetylase (PgdA/CDA1 family)/spore germination protein YaaH
MSVFRDRTGRRGAAVRLATVLGAAVALASVGTFLASVFPAPWTRKAVEAELAPRPRAPHGANPQNGASVPGGPQIGQAAPGTRPLEARAREAAYKREAGRLKRLLSQAARAQRLLKPEAPGQPVLAAFYVNWDAQSLVSLQAHKDQLTHVMPEWIRLAPDGKFIIEEDHRIDALVEQLEVMPTLSNYGDHQFSRRLARPILATEAARKDAAARMLDECRGHGWAGINLDLEDLGPQEWTQLAQLVEVAGPLLRREGFRLTVDVPAESRDVPVERLAAAADFLVLMAYDEHSSADNPGPIATPQGVLRSAAEYLRRAPADKLVMALGAYGYDWPLDADGDSARPAEELSYAQALSLARENEVPIEWDPESKSSFFEYDDDEKHEKHAVRFLDAPATMAQLQALAGLKLRGSALWRLGAEDPKLFELFAKAPRFRVFDEQAARASLDGVIQNAPDDVAIAGEGELISLKGSPQVGRRRVTLSPDGTVERVDYVQYPSGWILERKGRKPRGKLLLTFDDGPDPKWTPRVLDALDRAHARAVFFIIGENAEAHPELVRREVQAGHVVGNHTYSHPDLSRVSPLRFDLELNVTERLLEWLTGTHPRLFRPPYHSDESLDEAPNAQVVARASSLGYLTLGHDVDPEDFIERDPAKIAARVLSRARPGSVVLLHDGGGDRSATVAAIPLIVEGLRVKGLELADPSEITGLARGELLPAAPRDGLLSGADSLVFAALSGVERILGIAFGLAIGLLALRAVILAVAAPLQARRTRRAGPQPPGALTISAVVPAYNEETVIVRTVDSLLAQEPPLLEVVCVDDGSTDHTLEVLRKAYSGHPRVRILGKRNGGKSSALNLGFAAARGELVVALDSDTLFTKDTVAELCAPFANPRVAAVAGNAKVGNRVNRLTRWQALEYVTAQNLERRAWDLAFAVPVVPGAVGAWRRQTVLEAGGFHEDTLAEDTDLTLRLIAGGHRVVYAERALGYTEAPEKVRALLRQRFRWTYGVLQACWKHKSRLFRRDGGVLGWLILPAFAIYQFAVPLVAPAVDLLLVVSLVRGHAGAAAGYYLLFFALDLALSAVAILLEGEDLRLLAGLFVQRVAYRQLIWLALVKSIWTAFAGLAVGWGKLARTGTAQAGAAGRRRAA